VARFQSVINYYHTAPRFAGQPDILTFFSGDVFNPSLESTITKGRHMVPFLNKAKTNVACVGVSTPPGIYIYIYIYISLRSCVSMLMSTEP